MGQKVIIPDFPYNTHEELTKNGPGFEVKQSLSSWMKYCEIHLKDLHSTEKLCFIGHSVSCIFILHLLSKWNLTLDSAFFVAPFLQKLGGRWEFDYVNKTFYKNDFDFVQLKRLIPTSYVFYSDDDPAVPTKLSQEFAQKLGSQEILVRSAKHFSTESGFIQFPLLLELCKSRINRNL
ncbi:alpha/beta hydrolase [Candidatus Gottesmanbacteria bacterium]|nr:alpha/beta hydrolase [Candidatus Gottesmanbacteria bacterium]